MCDFEVRVLGNKHRHTVQCVLMINMFNEKVYLFLWFWLLGVFFATLANLVSWIVHMSSEERRRAYLSTYLRVNNLVSKDDYSSERSLRIFSSKGLRADGVLVMHLISKNAGDIITTDLMSVLWDRFLKDQQKETSAGNNGPSLDDVDGFREKAPLT